MQHLGAEEIITFDVYENGTALLSGADLGTTFPSGFFGLEFDDGFQTLASGQSANNIPNHPITLTPHSPLNAGFQDPLTGATVATIQKMDGSTFSLVQLYVGCVTTGALTFNPPVTVSITGSFQNVPIPACSYQVLFTGKAGTNNPPNLLSTPNCTAVDMITIDDGVGQNWYVDDLTVVVPA